MRPARVGPMSCPGGVILLAEDSPRDVELIMEALRGNRLANAVHVVRDGAEALDYLHRRGRHAGRTGPQPVLVLLDLKMPKLDGIEVLRRLKRDEQLKTLPVLLLSSSREEPDIAESYRLGVNAYVVKPIRFDEFVDAVGRIGAFWLLVNQPPIGS